MAKRTFQESVFYHCYDCGWGERGVHACMSFDQAKDFITDRVGKEAAERWEATEEGFFEFGFGDYHIVHESSFVDADWEGTDDW